VEQLGRGGLEVGDPGERGAGRSFLKGGRMVVEVWGSAGKEG